MQHRVCLIVSSLIIACTPVVLVAQDTEQAAREAAFSKLMSGCKMVGVFTTAGSTEQPQPETYELGEVRKVEGNKWRIKAKIQYAKKRAITVPITVRVNWAGDTPMIQVTDLKIPLMGTFTARVLVFRGEYTGTWSAKSHGGHMFGKVIPAAKGEDGAGDAKGQANNWPQFHGAFGRGVAEGGATPIQWDVLKGENVVWRTPIPGLAHSSPVVWGDRVFVTTAVGDGQAPLRVGLYGDIKPVEDDSEHQMQLLCLDKQSGAIRWSKTAWTGVPKIKRHPKGSHAASTPATDGVHVLAFFGSEGLYCYDVDGKLLWEKDLGVLDSGFFRAKDAQWGFASSPVIHDGKVIVQCDVQGDSFVAALDVKTGDDLWRTARTEVPTWSTPTVCESQGRLQVICNGWKHIGGYDFATGEELWKVVGGGDIPVPTPVVAHDLIFITSAHGRHAPILAISTGARGEFSMAAEESEHMVWSQLRRGNYMQTPIVYGDELYCCNDAGVLSVYEARTGKLHYRERLGAGMTGFTGSGVAATGRLYFTSEMGQVHVVAAGPTFKLLGTNPLGEECLSTPAVSQGVMFYRTRGHLVAVADRL
ncbi:MAG: pyrrolo-quinoline quinone [Planctomycetes bacterium]|nr:pyrrolo-quinoline quinone [Planctomycetota bacterium]